MRKKRKNSNTPRHKRFDRSGRLQVAKTWLATYNGSNIVRGYSIHFAVDVLCAVRELGMLGHHVEPKYVEQLKINLQSRLKRARVKKDSENQYYDCFFDERYLSNEEEEEKEDELPF